MDSEDLNKKNRRDFKVLIVGGGGVGFNHIISLCDNETFNGRGITISHNGSPIPFIDLDVEKKSMGSLSELILDKNKQLDNRLLNTKKSLNSSLNIKSGRELRNERRKKSKK